MDIIDIVGLGFHGVAVVFILLTYQLISKIVSIYSDKSTSNPTVRTLQTMISSVRLFMILSVSLATVGILGQILSDGLCPTASLTLNVYPTTDEAEEVLSMLKISHSGSEPLNLITEQANQLNVNDRDYLNVEYSEILDLIIEKDAKINQFDQQLRLFTTLLSPNSGYSNIDPLVLLEEVK